MDAWRVWRAARSSSMRMVYRAVAGAVQYNTPAPQRLDTTSEALTLVFTSSPTAVFRRLTTADLASATSTTSMPLARRGARTEERIHAHQDHDAAAWRVG